MNVIKRSLFLVLSAALCVASAYGADRERTAISARRIGKMAQGSVPLVLSVIKMYKLGNGRVTEILLSVLESLDAPVFLRNKKGVELIWKFLVFNYALGKLPLKGAYKTLSKACIPKKYRLNWYKFKLIILFAPVASSATQEVVKLVQRKRAEWSVEALPETETSTEFFESLKCHTVTSDDVEDAAVTIDENFYVIFIVKQMDSVEYQGTDIKCGADLPNRTNWVVLLCGTSLNQDRLLQAFESARDYSINELDKLKRSGNTFEADLKAVFPGLTRLNADSLNQSLVNVILEDSREASSQVSICEELITVGDDERRTVFQAIDAMVNRSGNQQLKTAWWHFCRLSLFNSIIASKDLPDQPAQFSLEDTPQGPGEAVALPGAAGGQELVAVNVDRYLSRNGPAAFIIDFRDVPAYYARAFMVAFTLQDSDLMANVITLISEDRVASKSDFLLLFNMFPQAIQMHQGGPEHPDGRELTTGNGEDAYSETLALTAAPEEESNEQPVVRWWDGGQFARMRRECQTRNPQSNPELRAGQSDDGRDFCATQ